MRPSYHTRLGIDLVKAQAAIFQRRVSLAANDDVVEYINVQQLAGFNDLASDTNILGRRARICRGVVMGQDKGRRIFLDRRPEQFADTAPNKYRSWKILLG